MAKIIIDNVTYDAPEGQCLLDAIVSLGLDLPYFCWHPSLGSVGACRQCAVIQFKDEHDDKGRLVMACMTAVQDGLRISITADRAVRFRAAVIEWLMTNHPHDCPVCDEGGECHLQDMTVMTGHNYRRHRFPKRTFRNQDLGPFIYHEMNRCITCYRCVRFYKDYAGGHDLTTIGGANHVYFGRMADGTLENEFSGNLVEVCPTGVFTDKTLRRHYSRKWDLQSAPSVCHHCSLGCNTFVGTRYDKPVRILNRYHPDINGYFLCDRGRFGYDFMNSRFRIRGLVTRGGDVFDQSRVMDQLAAMFKKPSGVIGIGSPRASLEANYALKQLVGPDNFSVGVSATERHLLRRALTIMQHSPEPPASLQDIAASDAVLILGEDITQTAPMMALAARQSVRNKPMQRVDALRIDRWNDNAVRELVQEEKGPLYSATVAETKLDDVASETCHATPDDIARLGFAVAAAVSERAPRVENLPEALVQMAQRIAGGLKNSTRPVIIAGTSLMSDSVLEAAANVATALREAGRNARTAFALTECNSLGAALIDGMDIDEALDRIDKRKVDSIIVLENNLYRHAAKEAVDGALDSVANIIAIDCIETPLTRHAAIVLPSAVYADGSGTIVNNEGRAQRATRALKPASPVQEAWRWCDSIWRSVNSDFRGWDNLDSISREVFNGTDMLKGKYPDLWSADVRAGGRRIARSPRPYSGRTAMLANISVHEVPPADDPDSPFAFSMEGHHGNPPEALPSHYWTPGWNSVQALSQFKRYLNEDTPGAQFGVRLFPGTATESHEYFQNIPGPPPESQEQLLAVPIYHIFGSEPLSSRAAAVSERIPEPYAGMSSKTAEGYHINAGDKVDLSGPAGKLTLPIRKLASLPEGVIALPVGLVDIAAARISGFYQLRKGNS